jgi:hypothetical protein
MKYWALLPLCALATASSCEDRCGQQANVGGGSAGHEVAMHVRVHAPAALLGADARGDLAEVLGLDPHILAQTDAARPVDVIVGRGKTGTEVHSAMMASADAQTELGKRYELEPLMLRQVRIKPADDRARCMIISEHITCASGEARLGRGVFEAERYTQASADADAVGRVVFSMNVVKTEIFAQHVLPLLRSHIERGLTRAKTEESLRARVLGDWDLMATTLSNVRVNGTMSGKKVIVRLVVAAPKEATSCLPPPGQTATGDLAVVGGTGHIVVSRTETAISLEMSRETLKSLIQVLTGSWPIPNDGL